MIASPVKLFGALSSEARLRMLFLLDKAELSVAELTEVLGLPQSTVSRLLMPLKELGLVTARREGTWIFYSFGKAVKGEGVYSLLQESFASLPKTEESLRGLNRVLEARRKQSQEYFNARAGFYGHGKEPGGSWKAVAKALGFALEGKDVVDLGSGEGFLALSLAESGANVIALDSSQNMVEFVRAKAKDKGLKSIKAMLGDLEEIPLPDASADFVLLSQSLHHAARPQHALNEAARLLRPGGKLVILDLVRHERENMRAEFGDLWLGFDLEDLKEYLRQAGLKPLNLEVLDGGKEIDLILAVGKK